MTTPDELYVGKNRPPNPVADCARCAELDERRTTARAKHDRSAETDMNVLLRRHQNEQHEEHEERNT
ncbi:hypothetical protein OK074_3175 [Actinobacteria bacterium OK074]|nr:hypothetical protein OK074_3175 [Actinobacteria bacterium OK074]